MGLGLVVGHCFLHPRQDGVAVSALLHIDEIDDDQPSDSAETDLTRDLGGRFGIDLEYGIFFVAGSGLVTPGIHVDRDESLGFVDYDLATGGQEDMAEEGLFDLALDTEALENWDIVRIVGYLRFRA